MYGWWLYCHRFHFQLRRAVMHWRGSSGSVAGTIDTSKSSGRANISAKMLKCQYSSCLGGPEVPVLTKYSTYLLLQLRCLQLGKLHIPKSKGTNANPSPSNFRPIAISGADPEILHGRWLMGLLPIVEWIHVQPLATRLAMGMCKES